MKKLSYEVFIAEAGEEMEHIDDFGIADACEMNQHEMLETFDKQLAPFGLELVQYNTDGDYYAWKVRRK